MGVVCDKCKVAIIETDHRRDYLPAVSVIMRTRTLLHQTGVTAGVRTQGVGDELFLCSRCQAEFFTLLVSLVRDAIPANHKPSQTTGIPISTETADEQRARADHAVQTGVPTAFRHCSVEGCLELAFRASGLCLAHEKASPDAGKLVYEPIDEAPGIRPA